MAKIPIGKTVQYAYSFTFGGLLNLLGTAWVGILILAVANYFFMRPYMGAFASFQTTRDFAQFASVFPLALIYFLATMIIYAMIKVVVLRQALGLSTQRHAAYFSLGKPVWQLLLAYLLLALV